MHSPHSSADGAANGHAKPGDGDTIVISDSDDDTNAFQSPKAQVNGSVGQRSPVTTVGGAKVAELQLFVCVFVCEQEEEEASESVGV